jgi:ribose transport system permease protein
MTENRARGSTPSGALDSAVAKAPAGLGRAAVAAPRGTNAGLLLLELGPALVLLLLIIAVSFASPYFLTPRNIGDVLAQSAVIAILAMGQHLVILTRGIDLSVGSSLALSSVMGGLLYRHVDSSVLVILTMLLTGATVGVVNGVIYVWGRLPHPFIVTLATLSVARGLALELQGGEAIPGMPTAVRFLGHASVGWLPVSTILVAVLALLVLFMARRLVWGRWIYAVGGNPEAAVRTGIPVKAVLVSVYVIAGLAAGIGAVVTSGRTNAASPLFGNLAELDSIAATIIGGASFLGGRGNVGNALVGALMIGVIRNALNLLNVDLFFQLVVIGIVIVLAVESDVFRGWLEERLRVQQALRGQ